jgi:hypothetical protein
MPGQALKDDGDIDLRNFAGRALAKLTPAR